MRRLLPLCLAVLGACGGETGPAGPEAPDPGPDVASLGRPPIVLIVFDALHAAHVGHLGYARDTTPHLDAIAAEGVSFSQAFSPAPYTLASIPSLLTGRRPDTHGVTSTVARLALEETTLAEICRRSGYRTMAAVGNLNGGSLFGTDQGFDTFEELFRDPDAPAGSEHADEGLRWATADMFVDFTRRMVARDGGDAPPFLYLHVLEPHAPYRMPERYRDLWLDPDYDGPFAGGDIQPLIDSLSGKVSVGPRDVAAATALYDGNLRWADDNLGEIRELLEQAGWWDRALVIVVSDHGEAFWEHDRWGHNDHLFDEQVHVPLVVKLPAGRGLRGVVRDDLVSILDVTPSVCQWLDVAPGSLPLDGRSLAAMCEDRDWHPQGRELWMRTHQGIANLALRTAGEKTIVERGRKEGDQSWGHLVRVRLYDLVADPREQHDLYAAERAHGDANAERLLAWGQASILQRSERGTGMTPGEVALLHGLGYVDAPPAYESRNPALDEP